MLSDASASEANDEALPADGMRVFICYRREDGRHVAEWVHRALHDSVATDTSGRERRLDVYLDVAAPGGSDWTLDHFPKLQRAHALILICTPGVAKDLSKPQAPDWVYEELRWWSDHRGSAPIVVDPTSDGARWLPDMIAGRWPNLNRISVDPRELEGSPSASDALAGKFRSRIIATLRASEHQTVYEDLVKAHRRSRQLAAALAATTVLLVAAIVAGLWAYRESQRAEEQAGLARQAEQRAEELAETARESEQRAVREAERVERLAAVATAKSWELSRRLSLAPEASQAPPELDRTDTVELLRLMAATMERPNDVDEAIIAVKIMQCFGPHNGRIFAEVFETFYATFRNTTDDYLKREVEQLRVVVDADQKGLSRPKVAGLERCNWFRKYSQ